MSANRSAPALAGCNTTSTIAQFCARHNVSRRTFANWRAAGRAPTVIRVGPRALRITAASEIQWLNTREQA